MSRAYEFWYAMWRYRFFPDVDFERTFKKCNHCHRSRAVPLNLQCIFVPFHSLDRSFLFAVANRLHSQTFALFLLLHLADTCHPPEKGRPRLHAKPSSVQDTIYTVYNPVWSCKTIDLKLSKLQVYAWGDNNKGQLGLSDQQSRYDPVAVEGLRTKTVIQVLALDAWHGKLMGGPRCDVQEEPSADLQLAYSISNYGQTELAKANFKL